MSAPVNTTAPVEVPVETPAVTEPLIAKSEETTAATAVEPTSTAAPVTASTEAPIVDTPVTEPSTEAATTTTADATTTATEETPVAEPTKAIDSGILGYKAPGLIKSLKFSKKHFWLGEEPVAHEKLSTYLRGEKPDVAHPAAAWASQTGTGLLFFAKHAAEKSTPSGILNLSEASDLEKQSPHEFSFKVHSHKHAFKAADDAERDGWYVAIEKAIAEAKVAKEGIVSSEGYKEAHSHLSKPAVLAGAAVPAAVAGRKSTDAPKVEEPARAGSSSSSSSDEAAAKKKSQSRSASRGKRSSIFGNFLNKKEEHDVKKDIKKEEKEEAKEEKKIEAEEVKAGEPVTETAPAVAPLDAEAVAARAIDAPVDETTALPTGPTDTIPPTVPVTEASKEEVRPKPATKRSSIFGSFFEKVRSPTHEKKEHEVAPVVPPKDTVVSAEPPVLPEPSTEIASETSAAAPVTSEAPVAAAPVVDETAPKTETATKSDTLSPRKEKESFFGGLINKARAKSPANVNRSAHKTEEAPVVPPKVEETTTVPAVEEPVVAAPVATTEAAAIDEPVTDATATATTPKESRRKSYFGAPGNKIAGIFRKPSQVARPSKDAKKENVVPATEETTAATETPVAAPATTADIPTATETKIEEPKSVTDATSEPLAVGQEHKNAPVVSSTA